MPTVKYLGKVIPSSLLVDAGPIAFKWREDLDSPRIEVKAVIASSKIEVSFTAPHLNDQTETLKMCLNLAYRCVRSMVDAIVFGEATGLLVHLTDVVTTDGKESYVIPHSEYLRGLCTSFAEHETEELQMLLIREPLLAMAIHDLTDSIFAPGLALVNCGRALETLRQVMYPATSSDAKERKKAWHFMNTMLNLEKSYTSKVTDESVVGRHGAFYVGENDATVHVLQRTWIIFDRYFHYRKGGQQQLDASTFPILY